MLNQWNLVSCISDKKRVGKVWLVSNQNDQSLLAYFKQSTPTSIAFSGPLPANEYLSYLLGKELLLPMAETLLTEIDGISGIISLKKVQNKKLYNWNKIKAMSNPFSLILNAEGLIKMFVFDVWIANIDRNNRNIILYKANKKGLYDYYLIDHGLSLLGAFAWKRKDWNSNYWKEVYKYNNRYLKGLPKFILNNQSKFQSYVTEIQDLSNDRIEEIFKQLPPYLLSDSDKDNLKSFLITRKAHLHQIIETWVKDFEQNR